MSAASSPALAYLAVVASSLCIGYFVGLGSSLSFTRSSDVAGELTKDFDSDLGSDSDGSEVRDDADGDLSLVKAEPQEDCTLVLVVRSDLGMSTGKIAAQCSHATLACYKALYRSNPSILLRWQKCGQPKIALKCVDENELLLLLAQAQSLNLCAKSIQDAGRTQIAAGSRTAVGIGPENENAGPVKLINEVTGKLQLL